MKSTSNIEVRPMREDDLPAILAVACSTDLPLQPVDLDYLRNVAGFKGLAVDWYGGLSGYLFYDSRNDGFEIHDLAAASVSVRDELIAALIGRVKSRLSVRQPSVFAKVKRTDHVGIAIYRANGFRLTGLYRTSGFFWFRYTHPGYED